MKVRVGVRVGVRAGAGVRVLVRVGVGVGAGAVVGMETAAAGGADQLHAGCGELDQGTGGRRSRGGGLSGGMAGSWAGGRRGGGEVRGAAQGCGVCGTGERRCAGAGSALYMGAAARMFARESARRCGGTGGRADKRGLPGRGLRRTRQAHSRGWDDAPSRHIYIQGYCSKEKAPHVRICHGGSADGLATAGGALAHGHDASGAGRGHVCSFWDRRSLAAVASARRGQRHVAVVLLVVAQGGGAVPHSYSTHSLCVTLMHAYAAETFLKFGN